MSTERASSDGEMQTSYGYKSVLRDEKQSRIDEVFHRVAKHYDLMNDIMSGGMHHLWKRDMISTLNPRKDANYRFLDVAGGTGDIAFRIVEASDRKAGGMVVDINRSMLGVGQERARKNGLQEHLEFIEANAEMLPFRDNYFDAYTISFGIRNVPDINRALSEAYRVLRYGGQLLVLEFSVPDIPILDKFYDIWSFHGIPKFGKFITGDAEPYQYLVESIRKFPNQENFATIIRKANFDCVRYKNYTGGIVALHTGWKI